MDEFLYIGITKECMVLKSYYCTSQSSTNMQEKLHVMKQ